MSSGKSVMELVMEGPTLLKEDERVLISTILVGISGNVMLGPEVLVVVTEEAIPDEPSEAEEFGTGWEIGPEEEIGWELGVADSMLDRVVS